MKRISTLTLTFGLLACSSLVSLAQTAPSNAAPAAVATTNKVGSTARPNLLQIIGLTPKELNGLSSTERNAKIKAAVDKRIADLEKKKATTALTDQETRDLALLLRHKKATDRPHPTMLSTNLPPLSTNTPAAPKEKN